MLQGTNKNLTLRQHKNVYYMQSLHFYTTLLEKKQQQSPDEAAYLEEEIDIVLHKLKFIPQEGRPSVLLLDQQQYDEALYNEQLADSVAIAGGRLVAEKYDNPEIILIVQHNEQLYTDLPQLLQDDIISRSDALQNNKVFIIQQADFGKDAELFLRDVEICAELLQPKYFIYGHQGADWVQFDMQ